MTDVVVTRQERPFLRLLGGFELLVDQCPVALPANAQRVLGYLAVNRSNLRREELAGRLWQGSTEERAHASLRTALWRIRRVHPELVTASHEVVRLHDNLGVDLRETTALARLLLEPGGGSDEDALSCPVRLLESDLLPHWDEEWVLLERERLRQLRLHALDALSRRLTAAGRFAAAIDAAYAAIAAEPLRESAWTVLIEAHLAEGNQADAVRRLLSYRTLLADELGLEPSQELSALVPAEAVAACFDRTA